MSHSISLSITKTFSMKNRKVKKFTLFISFGSLMNINYRTCRQTLSQAGIRRTWYIDLRPCWYIGILICCQILHADVFIYRHIYPLRMFLAASLSSILILQINPKCFLCFATYEQMLFLFLLLQSKIHFSVVLMKCTTSEIFDNFSMAL